MGEQPAAQSLRAVDLLISGGYLATQDDQRRVIYPGSVAVAGSKIVAVGPSSAVDLGCAPRQRLDAHEHVVLPGLVNIHGHASNSLIRGLGGDRSLHDWLHQVCWPCMAQAGDEDLYQGVLLSALEMLLNGVTAFADMWPGVPLSASAVAATGQRAVLAHNIKDFGDARRGEAELQAALDAWRQCDGHADGRVVVGLGPHSVYTCRPELLAACAAEAARHNLHLQIHGSETRQEVEECRAQHGCSPIELMAACGLLGARTIVAHAVHVNQTDLTLLLGSRTNVSHNIASNLKLASGIAPVDRYLQLGLCVGLGTDGPGSNDSLNLLADLKLATLLQKAISQDATCLPAQTALDMVTRHGAQALGLAEHLGSLEPGKQADLILIDLDQPHFTPRHFDRPDNILSHLVTCATGADVDTVVVAGRVLVRHGQPVHLDCADIQARAQASSRRLLQAAGLLG
ncbi:MAG: amidohydrolase [Anaerolineales bacterium]|nr:amidohydrolase [Anaerolineales bacterium]